MLLSVAVALGGIWLARHFYVHRPQLPDALARSAGGLYTTLSNKWYVDEIYGYLFVDGLAKGGGSALARFDNRVVDGGVNGATAWPCLSARGGGSLADLFAFCDETLCRTVALLRVPVVASVGHHTDQTLIDDVAAVSCSTPTHAAEAADIPAIMARLNSECGLVVQSAENALALGGSGWAELAPQPEWNPEDQLSVSMWVKLDDLEGMPVLICKGAWQQSGYFLQIFREQLRFYIAGVGTLDAGYPSAGEWQHLAATYGFGEMQAYINGELVGRKRVAGRPRPSANPLLVGRYALGEDVYFVRGMLDDIVIHNVCLAPEEVRAIYDGSKRD